MTKGKYDGLYFTMRGGMGFIRLTGTKAHAYPVFFDERGTFERWRETTLSIPFKFMFEIELENDNRKFED